MRESVAPSARSPTRRPTRRRPEAQVDRRDVGGEPDEVEGTGEVDRVGDPRRHLVVRVDDAAGADAPQDLPVELARGPGEDDLGARALEDHRREDRGRRVDRDHGHVEVGRPDLPDRVLVGRVHLEHLGEPVRVLGDDTGVAVAAHDLVAQPRELARRRCCRTCPAR